jgi:N-acetylmuramoyl-L-alanine amidase
MTFRTPSGIVTSLLAALIPITVAAATVAYLSGTLPSFSDTEAGFESPEDAPPAEPVDPYADWTRKPGPWRVALQAGHWRVDEVPEELVNLKGNTGAYGGGRTERDVNLAIAEAAAAILRDAGVIVDVLPSTIPPDYEADAFVAIHADGNPNPEVRGYKAAAPRRDRSGKSGRLLELVENAYGEATGMQKDPNVTRNMRGYYAFNWRKYEHALHPMTPAIILETGFLTSPRDRRIIVDRQDIPATAVAEAVLAFLQETLPLSGLESGTP